MCSFPEKLNTRRKQWNVVCFKTNGHGFDWCEPRLKAGASALTSTRALAAAVAEPSAEAACLICDCWNRKKEVWTSTWSPPEGVKRMVFGQLGETNGFNVNLSPCQLWVWLSDIQSFTFICVKNWFNIAYIRSAEVHQHLKKFVIRTFLWNAHGTCRVA